jgi:hypothetical protein
VRVRRTARLATTSARSGAQVQADAHPVDTMGATTSSAVVTTLEQRHHSLSRKRCLLKGALRVSGLALSLLNVPCAHRGTT